MPRYVVQNHRTSLLKLLLILGVAALLGLLRSSARGESSSKSSSARSSAVVDLIDTSLRTAWKENGLRPAKPATDAQWCRRVYLDLLGRVPTVTELDAYLSDKTRDKRARLVDRLLGEEYLEDYAQNWSTIWSNVLIGRTGGRERRTLMNRQAFADYLQTAARENRRYDQLARELITAVGSAHPEGEDFNPAANFLVEKLAEDSVQATAKTSEIFLGTAVQCTQCHNHPFNEYRQNQFWELNAFFRQTEVERTRNPDEQPRFFGKIVDRDFAGEGRSLYRDNRDEIILEVRNGQLVDSAAAELSEAPIYYELRNGQVQVAYPVFIDGTALEDLLADRGSDFGNSGYLKHVNRREELASLLIESREFDQALMNRLWAHFFGYGFTKPVHDMGPHNPASNPELLEKLGNEFRSTGFDLREAMRWIVLSEAYSLSSRISSGNRKDDPALGVSPQFSRFYVRQMQPEQLYESLITATEAHKTMPEDRQAGMKERWLRQFTQNTGNDDGGETTTFNGSIPQTLMMMNGDLIRRACSTDNGSFLDNVANDSSLSNREKIHYLYRAALARRPTKHETNVCNDLLSSRGGDVVGSLQDIWWAVLNSNEFILIH